MLVGGDRTPFAGSTTAEGVSFGGVSGGVGADSRETVAGEIRSGIRGVVTLDSGGAVIEIIGCWDVPCKIVVSVDSGALGASESTGFGEFESEDTGGSGSCLFDEGVSSASSEGCRFREPVMNPYCV